MHAVLPTREALQSFSVMIRLHYLGMSDWMMAHLAEVSLQPGGRADAAWRPSINNKDLPTTWESLSVYRLPPNSHGEGQTSLWGQIPYYKVPNIFLGQKLSKSIKTAPYLLFEICLKCTARDLLKTSEDYSIASSRCSLLLQGLRGCVWLTILASRLHRQGQLVKPHSNMANSPGLGKGFKRCWAAI